jgi:hypothetical protein
VVGVGVADAAHGTMKRTSGVRGLETAVGVGKSALKNRVTPLAERVVGRGDGYRLPVDADGLVEVGQGAEPSESGLQTRAQGRSGVEPGRGDRAE